MVSTENATTCSHVYDVIIVGAGPCGLAVAARLCEPSPSALFTDEEQARYSWIMRNRRRTSIKDKRTGRVKRLSARCGTCAERQELSMLVLDASGADWMSRWNALFETFGIDYLRSPMFFHPDPSDRDALLGYVFSEHRTSEMQEIAGCVGKEMSKHKKRKQRNSRSDSAQPALEIDERDRKDYFAPSTKCFRDFCYACQDRYGLSQHIVRHEAVHDIDYDFHPDVGWDEKVFTIRTNGRLYLARNVVLAVGAGRPQIPAPFPSLLPETACHTMLLPNGTILTSSLKAKIDSGCRTHALVIGGGLTGAQIVHALICKGVGRVTLLMRSHWKVKPFDVDLEWMSKFKNHQRAAFWSADSFDERLQYVREARKGGSMTPRFAKLLKGHINNERLSVHPNTVVARQSYDPQLQTWSIATEPTIKNLPAFDHIYFATGMQTSLDGLDLLQTLREKIPIDSHGGFPALTDDLSWAPHVPLFVAGKLATLQLGPGAGNLEGARLGAERIAWAVEERMQPPGGLDLDVSGTEARTERLQYRYAAGIGSRFEGLSISERTD